MIHTSPLFAPPDSIQARFDEFDRAHPEVFAEFKALAIRLYDRGVRHYSADAILHVVRFHRDVNERHDGGFKINNTYTSRYARKLAAEDWRFIGFFTTRVLQRA